MKKVCGYLLALCFMLTTWAGGAAAADSTTMLSRPEALTMADNGATVVLTVGDRFALKLGQAPPDWEVSITDENVLSRVRNIATMIGVQGVYTATAPGTAVLSAVGTFPCQRTNPRCMIASPLFRVTVVVRPAPTTTAEFTIGQAVYTTDGGLGNVTMEGAAFIESNRTYVPALELASALRADLKRDGDAATLGVAQGGAPVKLQAGSQELTLGPDTVAMDVAPVVRDGVLYLPLRWVAEALGYRVHWNAETRSVTVGAQ
jgi:hypothetical protein